jgi:hypothetical protein
MRFHLSYLLKRHNLLLDLKAVDVVSSKGVLTCFTSIQTDLVSNGQIGCPAI